MSDLPICLVYRRGCSRILTQEEAYQMLFGAESDLDDEKTDDELEDNFDSIVPTEDPLIQDTIENVDDAELDRLLNVFDEIVNSQTNAENCDTVSEEINFTVNDPKNETSDQSDDVSNFEVISQVPNESKIDGAPPVKRAKRPRNSVQRKKSPSTNPSTSSSIIETQNDVQKSAKKERKSASKSQNLVHKASAKKTPKSNPKNLKSASSIAKDKMKSIHWKKGSLFFDIPITKDIVYSEELSSLRIPYDFFRYFFTISLSNHICEQTTLYSTQLDPAKPFQISTEDLDKFLGVLILHSVTPCKNFHMHWNPNVGNPVVRETMTINQFEKIRQFLHFADNSQILDRTDADFDKLFKIHPFIEAIRNRFLSIPMEEHLSLDEQMCSTKAKHHLRQYMPLKPKKHGFKFFVLCGASGFGYVFGMYVGSSNAQVEAEADFGATSNVVLRLTQTVPPNVGHKIFFDNFYTALSLLVKLHSRRIYALGTVQKNRIINSPLTNNIDKKPRGYTEGYVTQFQECPLSLVQWKDNKTVVLLSSFLGVESVSVVERFIRQTKKRENVVSPHVIQHYNRHMGGVDLLDGIMAKCKIIMRSKNRYLRIFYHLLDFLVTNAWFMHQKFSDRPLSVVEFRIELGTVLCKRGAATPTRNRGRPTMSGVRKKKPLAPPRIPVDAQYDEINHWPQYGPKRDCKFKNCTSRSQNSDGIKTKPVVSRSRWLCGKCDVNLCLTGTQNCFQKYHLK